MAMVLKYFFGLNRDRLYLSNVPCPDGKIPERPKNFLKWYEDGDIDCSSLPLDYSECEMPLFQAVFSPKRITFSVEDAKLQLSKGKL